MAKASSYGSSMELTPASSASGSAWAARYPGPLAEGPLAFAAPVKGSQPPLCDYCKGAGAPVMTIVRMNSMLRQPVIPTSFPTSERSKNIGVAPKHLGDVRISARHGPQRGVTDKAQPGRDQADEIVVHAVQI